MYVRLASIGDDEAGTLSGLGRKRRRKQRPPPGLLWTPAGWKRPEEATEAERQCAALVAAAGHGEGSRFRRYQATIQCIQMTVPPAQQAQYLAGVKKPKVGTGFATSIFGRILRGLGVVASYFIPVVGQTGAVAMLDSMVWGGNFYQGVRGPQLLKKQVSYEWWDTPDAEATAAAPPPGAPAPPLPGSPPARDLLTPGTGAAPHERARAATLALAGDPGSAGLPMSFVALRGTPAARRPVVWLALGVGVVAVGAMLSGGAGRPRRR